MVANIATDPGRASFCYTAYGLTIRSALHCPELLTSAGEQGASFDVEIRLDSVPSALEAPSKTGMFYEARPGRYLLRVPGVARYMVVDGRKIVVERVPDARESEVRLFLLGPVFGALLLQRGLLLLRGSAIATKKGAVAFVGSCVSGKSALAAAFLKRGYPVLADNICAIEVAEGQPPRVLPAFPRLYLRGDMMTRLGEDVGALEPVRPGLEKFALPLQEEGFANAQRPLYAVYELEDRGHWPVHRFDLTPCRPTERFLVLSRQAYQSYLLVAMGLRTVHFQHAAAVARYARFVHVVPCRQPTWLAALEEDFF